MIIKLPAFFKIKTFQQALQQCIPFGFLPGFLIPNNLSVNMINPLPNFTITNLSISSSGVVA